MRVAVAVAVLKVCCVPDVYRLDALRPGTLLILGCDIYMYNIYIYIYILLHMYIYIYIYRERERLYDNNVNDNDNVTVI